LIDRKFLSLQKSRHFRGFPSCLLVIIAAFHGSAVCTALGADAADEARTINQQVLALIKTSNLGEAETLAKKGLLLCDNVSNFKVFCASQFNESLGDIAFSQANYAAALAYQEQALHLREAGLDSGHLLIGRSLQRVAKVYLALQRTADAESLVERAVASFEKLVPIKRELAISLGYLRKIYLDTDRIDKAVAVARRELEVYQAIGDGDTQAVSNAKVNLSAIMSRQAQIALNKNSYSDAEPILIEAIKLVDPPPAGKENVIAALQAQLGSAYEKQRRFAEAEPFMLRALEYRSKIAGPADTEMPTMLGNLASLYSNLARPADTISYAVRAISWFDQIKQEKSALGFVLLQLARAQQQLGRFTDAETAFVRSIDVLDRTLPESEPLRINIRIEVGTLRTGQERYGDAEQAFLSALEAEPKLARPAIGWRSNILSHLGLVYREQARYPEAERSLLEAVKLEETAGNTRAAFLGPRLTELASVYRRQNRYADAESTLLRALALDQSKLDRAAALNSLGVVYTTIDQYNKAEGVLNEALAIRSKELAANNFFTAETIGNLATVDTSRGHYADAEAKLRHVLEVIDALDQSRFTNAALYSSLLSQTLISEGKLDEADTLIRRALELYQKRLGPDHPRFGGALKVQASIEALRGRDREAEDHYRQALAIDEKAIGQQSPAVAGDLINLVPLLKRAGKLPDAKAAIERALAINTAQFGTDSPMTAGAMLTSANMAYEAGQYADARQTIDRIRRIQERSIGPEHYLLAGIWTFMARLDLAQGKPDDARASIDRAALIVGKALPPAHPSNIDVLLGKADVIWAVSGPAGAEQPIRDALAIADRLYEPDYPVRRNLINRLGGALWSQDKFDDAERLHRDELAGIELKRGPDHPGTAIALRGLADLLASSGRQGEAIALYRRALAIDERSFGSQSDQAAWDHLALGSLFRRVGQFDEARSEINLARTAWETRGSLLAASFPLQQLAQLAFDQGAPAESVVFAELRQNAVEQIFGPNSPVLVPSLANLARFYLVVGRNDAAEKILVRIDGMVGKYPPEQTPAYLNVLELRAQLDAVRSDFAAAEAGFVRAIATATKYNGGQSGAVGINSFNLAIVCLKTDRFQEAIKHFAKALDIFKRENGDRAPVVGYTLLAAAQAYSKMGDEASSRALRAAADEILGPTIAAQRPEPNWL
jgi:tetratricopeptide (TPR) repeat protein